jgi:four helix bundle protein
MNSQLSSGEARFDPEGRLLECVVRVIGATEKISPAGAGPYGRDPSLRAGLSPYGNHGEARGAESRNDFIHQLGVCYKELCGSRRRLKLIRRTGLVPQPRFPDARVGESDELVGIIAKSLQTAKKNQDQSLEC